MDYTTLARVKLEAIKVLDPTNTSQDALLNALITSASRSIDRQATGGAMNSDNYLLMEDVVDESLVATVDNNGTIRTAPRKPIINSVASMSYRVTPAQSWTPVDSELVYADEQFAVASGALAGIYPGKVFVQLSYNGGLAETVAALPGDVTELATLLAARLYREAESGLADAIGVAEIGQLLYTKAWPIRFTAMLQPFMRVLPWRGA